jgi:hypothetical protein
VLETVFVLFRLLAIGLGVVIMQALGGGRYDTARRTAVAGLGASTWIGLLAAACVLLGNETMLRLLNAPAEVHALAGPFLVLLAPAVLLEAYNLSLAVILHARDSLRVMLAMHASHLLLALLLMHGIGSWHGLGLPGYALMVLFMRVAGRPLDGFTVLPRNLLRYAAGALGVAAPSIASLRSIYRRKQTLFSHQRWAKEYLGLTELEPAQEQDLVSALEVQAQDAAHTDDLVQAARHWLFTRRILIPSNRRLLDWVRDAFAKIEAQIGICVADAVGRANAAKLLLSVYAPRPGTDVSRIEWLKTPPRRHSPTTLAETLEKVRYLKSLGVHEWDLSGVVLARQQAYARQIQARRPYRSRDIRIAAQLVEVVCFLRVTLLELTDTALHLASRRAQQLVRSAAERARTRHAQESASQLRQATLAKAVLHDSTKSWEERVLWAQELLAAVGDAVPVSFASRVRKALAEDSTRVHACLDMLSGLEFQGGPKDAGFAQWQAWTASRVRGGREDVERDELPDVGAAWRGLVHHPDRKAGWRAFEASTMLALRRSLRRGSVWIDHSLSFQSREQLLIPPQQWVLQQREHVELLGVPGSFDALLMPLVAAIHAGMQALVEALRMGKVEIGTDRMLHLPALAALPDDGEPVRTREAIYQRIGDVQLPDLILEVDAATNFSDALLGHRAASSQELIAVYGALLAHGTDLDARGVAHMIPELEAAQILVAMCAIEGNGRLRRANERVVEFQSRIPLAALWGEGDKATRRRASCLRSMRRGTCGTRGSIRAGAPTPRASTPTFATAGASSTTSPSCSTNVRPVPP